MSATILSRIVDLDELIPRTVDVEREGKIPRYILNTNH